MTFTVAHSQPLGASTAIHSESNLLVIPNPSFAQIDRSRAVLFSQGGGAVYSWFAGQAYVDFVKAAVANGHPTTIDGLKAYVRKVRRASYNHVQKKWTGVVSAGNASSGMIDVYTFKHGFFSGCGSNRVIATAATNYTDGNVPNSVFTQQLFDYGAGDVYDGAAMTNNCAYVLLPTDVSVPELARRLVATQSHWIPGAREYISGELVRFLAENGYTESTRYMDPVLIGWDQTGALRYVPPSILMPLHNRASSASMDETWFKGPKTRCANPLGGRVETSPGIFHHMPMPLQNIAYDHLGVSGNYTHYASARGLSSMVLATKLGPGPMERGNPGVNSAQAAFSVDGVNLASLMSGQPYATFYDTTSRAARNWGGTPGVSIFDQMAMATRWSMTMDDDFTQTEAALTTQLSVDGVVTTTKVAQFASAQTNDEAPTNYDSVCLTARKLRRLVTECSKVAGTKVVFDAGEALRIMSGEL